MKFEEFELEKDWKEKLDYSALQRRIIEQTIEEYKRVIARGKSIKGECEVERLETYINEEVASIVGAKKGELQKKYIMQKIAEIAATLTERKKGKMIQNLVYYIEKYHKEWH